MRLALAEALRRVGVDGLLRDKTRPPGRKPLAAELKAKVLAKTARETPPDATHWSVRTMAKAVGISHTSVQRIWREAGLKPHLTPRSRSPTIRRGEGHRHRRPLHEPAGQGSRAVRRQHGGAGDVADEGKRHP